MRGKGIFPPVTPPEDIFSSSEEEEEEVADKPQEEQLEESQDAIPRPESPVLPDLKRPRTEK